jgi:hypothetical protein
MRYTELEFEALQPTELSPYSLNFFINVTNQIVFANASSCDNMIRIFNTSLTTGANQPTFVKGRVKSNLGPFVGETDFTNVYALQASTAFIENNYLPCTSFQGYQNMYLL